MRNRKRRETIYLDTSVVGAYFDERMPERQALTREFWKKLKEFDIFISELVLDELRRIRDKKLQRVVLNLVKGFEKLDSTPEVEDL
ncbi:MAG: PIN domain-containing protein, partial [candidate division NC10 bacterium]|nr:PIN domain-containing protein [candidate division NC10 bacterium]